MANKLPCPNPTCTHEFSQAELQATAQLACPKCGFRMQGRATAPAKAAPVKPATPTAKPVVALPKPATPTAKPIAAAPKPAAPKPATAPPVALPIPPKAQPRPASPAPPPLAQPIPAQAAPIATSPLPPAAPPVSTEESLPDGSFFNPGVAGANGALVRTAGKPKRPFNWMRLLTISFAVGFAACIVIVAIVSVLWLLLGTEGMPDFAGKNADGSIYWYKIRGDNGNENALKLVIPRESWEVDREMQNRFGANAAWKMKDDDLWFAVLVKDYGQQKPRDAEMVKFAIDKLEGHFGEALELAAKADAAKFADLPAQKLQFKGQAKSANWLGDCWMFFKDGIAYWVFIASPEWQKVADFEDEMPTKRVFVAAERRGWREQPWPMQTFKSEGGKVTMSAPKDVWDQTAEAKNVDEKGILVLAGKYLAEKDNRKNAGLLVFTFDKKDDLKAALVFARDYLEKKDENENKNFKIVQADDMVKGQGEIGTVEDVGNRRGRIIDLKRLFNDEPKRYFLLAVVNDPDTAYGILCECSWEHRQIWRQDFIDILRTMKIKKAE